MKYCPFFVLVLLMSACSFSQTSRPEATVLFSQKDLETQNSKESVQGTAIWGDLLFSMRNTGLCVVTDLSGKSLVSEFQLASHGVMNHANDAFFSGRFYEDGDKFPLLYVSQCMQEPVPELAIPELDSLVRLCFVERVLTDGDGRPSGTELVQVINYEPSKWNSRLWVFDPTTPQWIFCYGNTVGNMKEGNRIIVQKLSFPEFDKDNFIVRLTDSDVIESFYVDEVLPDDARGPQDNILQGGTAYKGKLYLPVGLGDARCPSELFVIDMNSRDRNGKPYKYAYYDYSDVIPCEMEDVDVWNELLICTTNSKGRVRPVYSFPLKNMHMTHAN